MGQNAKYAALGFGAVLGVAFLAVFGPAVGRFASERLVPFVGWSLLVAVVLVLLLAAVELLGGRARGALHGAVGRLSQSWQHARARRALERRARAAGDEQRARMLARTAEVHERAALAVTDAKARQELEELKLESERVLLRAQAHEIERFVLRYEVALTQISSSPNMTPALKAQLLRDLRVQLCAELDGPAAADDDGAELAVPTTRPSS